MKLSDIRIALRETRLSPAKTLGQNFLHDQNLARWIVDQAQITPADYVVEIGPGLGALTRFILEKGARVLAIEKDARLANFLRAHFGHERLEVLNNDALKFDPRALFAHRQVKLLGNLPYNISLELPARDDELLLKLIRTGFSQRRKQLRKLLRTRVSDWDRVASHLDINPKARAEVLSLLQWIDLTNFIAPLPRPDTRLTKIEHFPIVDKNDRILGYASRSQVHGNNLLHRAVHILIFDEAGDVYLQQRSRWKDRHPLKWDSSAAGHVAASESYDETARRELKEELGVSVPLQKFL